jgi:hypothetical protein
MDQLGSSESFMLQTLLLLGDPWGVYAKSITTPLRLAVWSSWDLVGEISHGGDV